MDAREVKAWLDSRVGDENEIMSPATEAERTPMTDLQWRKLNTMLEIVTFQAGVYDKRFVCQMVKQPYDFPITVKQTNFIEFLWEKYRRQHQHLLCPTRWICDYKDHLRKAIKHKQSFKQSKVGKFYERNGEPDLVELTEADVIPDEMSFWKW